MALEDVEGATKIRLRYLRAMENEEWDALPGGTYSRAFLRTYASYLGLDGERIADDYRDAMDVDGADRSARVEPTAVGCALPVPIGGSPDVRWGCSPRSR